MSLLGSLDEVPLADVLRMLSGGRKTGLLTITAGTAQAVLHFQRGALVAAQAGRRQGDDAVLDLFGWTEGELHFTPEVTPAPPNVARAVDALVAEGTRRGGVLHKLHALVPSDRVVFQFGPGPTDDSVQRPVGRREWRVLRLLDGRRDVREVVQAAGLPREDVLLLLAAWSEAGFLERVEAQKSLRVQAQGLFGREGAEVDVRYDGEWRRLLPFAQGVTRIEVRTLAGRSTGLAVTFKNGLYRDVLLPRPALVELSLREGDEVFVKPLA
jgi:hypothetical protein